MNINRNNYEEFLLLYIDGELTPELEQEVNAFLELNTDIKQEFDDLLNTKLQPENVSFGDISCLLKSEEKSIGINNCEEKFLLFVDNELSNQEKQSVETFVLQHPELQSSFTAFKNTVLPLEIIQHPIKEELYKKEKKSIVFYLQRMAVAAVFIGFAAFVWNLNSSNKNSKVATIQTNKIVNLTNNNFAKSNTENSVLKENSLAENNIKKSKNLSAFVVKNVQLKKQKIENNLATAVTKNTPQPLTNQSSISPNNQVQINNTQSLATTNIITNNSNINNNNSSVALAANYISSDNNSTAKQIVYKSLDDDDNNSSTTNVKQVKTSKLKGFFKKAIQVITPKESDNNESKKLFAVTL